MNRHKCMSCGGSSTPHYMLKDEIWKAVGKDDLKGYMCLGCVNSCIKGGLQIEYFRDDLMINAPYFYGYNIAISKFSDECEDEDNIEDAATRIANSVLKSHFK